ncbi:SDR family oxidoreductase [Microbacterium sp. NPDC076895]|uniref:SDR family oxidoreductase n=1 Tax=Microbacterium sp. NPDC076895 TaxID=3154957 RepID=UPI00342BE627
MTLSHESSQLAVVSGASTGMGRATAVELSRRGFDVLAGVRRASDGKALRQAGIEPVILDITEPDTIAALRDRIDSHHDERPLRVLVNNAGIAANAPVEALPLEVWRRVFEVNVFGQIALTQALLPALHRSGGRVVDISSTGGRIAMPAYGAYSGSKFAIEAISDAMRQELAPQGVQVVIVEPGGVRTAMGDRGSAVARDLHSQMTVEQHDRYDRLMAAFLSHSATFASEGVSAEEAAKVIARAATDRRPRTRYTIGRDAALLTRLARILPDRMMDRAIARTLRPHYPKG